MLNSYQNLAKWHLKRNINFAQIYIGENKKRETQAEDFFLEILGNKNTKLIYNTTLDTYSKNNTTKKKLPSIINPPLNLTKLKNVLKPETSLEHKYKIIQLESSEQILLLVDISNLDQQISSFIFISRLGTQLCNNPIEEIKTINCKNKNWNILNSTVKTIKTLQLQNLEENKEHCMQRNKNIFFKKLFHSFASSKICKAPNPDNFQQFNEVKLKYDNLKGKKYKIDFGLGVTNDDLLIDLKQITPWSPKFSHGNYYLQKEWYRHVNYVRSNYHLSTINNFHKHYSPFSFIEKGALYHITRKLYPDLIISTNLKLMETFSQSVSIIKKPYLNFQKGFNSLLKIEKEREKKVCAITLDTNKQHKVIFWETRLSKQDNTIKINDILNPNNKLSLKITNILLASNTFFRTFFIQIQAKYTKTIKLRQFNYYYFDKIETGEGSLKINYVPKDINFIEHILTNPNNIRSKRILNRRMSTAFYRCRSSIEYYLQLNENLNSIFFLLNYITKLNQFKHLPPTYPIKGCILHRIDYTNEISMGIGAQTFNDENKASVLRLKYCLNNSQIFFLTLKLFSIT